MDTVSWRNTACRRRAKNYDAALLQMTNGLEWNVRLGYLPHSDGSLHTRGLPFLFQEILQRETIHHSSQHAHIVAAGAIDTSLLKFAPRKKLPPPTTMAT